MSYISHENGYFFAKVDCPIAVLLATDGWPIQDGYHYTQDIKKVLQFKEHFDDALINMITAGAAKFDKSYADEPSPGFVPVVPPDKTLRPFQAASVERMLELPGCLLAETCGAGKSPMMIAFANHIKARSILIICPAVAKYNWSEKEWVNWTTQHDLTVGVVDGSAWMDTDVVIINYDILDRHNAKIHARQWDLLICDESHRINNDEARRTKLVFGGAIKIKFPVVKAAKAMEVMEDSDISPEERAERLVAMEQAVQDQRDSIIQNLHGTPLKKEGWYKVPPIKAKRRIFASATPLNKPKHMWTMVRELDPNGLGKDWAKFHLRYCNYYRDLNGPNIEGSNHLDELGALMRARFMIRHSNSVLNLPDLEDQIFLLPPVEIKVSDTDAFLKQNMDAILNMSRQLGLKEDIEMTYSKVMTMIGEAILSNAKLIGAMDFAVMFTEFAKVREATGVAKVPHVIEYIKNVREELGAEEPIVIFGYHQSVMKLLREEFPKASFVIGGMTAKKRRAMEKAFQAGETNEFLGNIDAAGEAITLTRSCHLFFAELDWRGTSMIQASKRIYRITQERDCTVTALCAHKSFDRKLAEVSFKKMKTIGETLDL